MHVIVHAVADGGGASGGLIPPPPRCFACQFESSYGPAFLGTLNPHRRFPGFAPGVGLTWYRLFYTEVGDLSRSKTFRYVVVEGIISAH